MKVGIPRMTIEEWNRLPDDGNRYELIDGELLVSPAPKTNHQRVSRRLVTLLDSFVTSRRLGEVFHAAFDVYLESESQTCVEPDIVFVANQRLHLIADEGLRGVPDLVVEILSESTRRVDLSDKLELYRRTGVPEYWVADPERRSIAVYRFADSDQPRTVVRADTLTSPLFPGLEIQLRSVFDY